MNNLILKPVINEEEIHQLQRLALCIFPVTYQKILSAEQINYMLDKMYNKNVLIQQINKDVQFFLLKESKQNIGYLSVEPNHKNQNLLYIHKIYLLPEKQGLGYGKWMLGQSEEIAKKFNLTSIGLNVNRYNQALEFYKKLGFVVEKEEDIAIGNGFWMNDYYMMKILSHKATNHQRTCDRDRTR